MTENLNFKEALFEEYGEEFPVVFKDLDKLDTLIRKYAEIYLTLSSFKLDVVNIKNGNCFEIRLIQTAFFMTNVSEYGKPSLSCQEYLDTDKYIKIESPIMLKFFNLSPKSDEPRLSIDYIFRNMPLREAELFSLLILYLKEYMQCSFNLFSLDMNYQMYFIPEIYSPAVQRNNSFYNLNFLKHISEKGSGKKFHQYSFKLFKNAEDILLFYINVIRSKFKIGWYNCSKEQKLELQEIFKDIPNWKFISTSWLFSENKDISIFLFLLNRPITQNDKNVVMATLKENVSLNILYYCILNEDYTQKDFIDSIEIFLCERLKDLNLPKKTFYTIENKSFYMNEKYKWLTMIKYNGGLAKHIESL